MRLDIDLVNTRDEPVRAYKIHEMPLDADVARGYVMSAVEASRLQHEYIGTEHILLGMLNEPSMINIFKGIYNNDGGAITVASTRREVNKLVRSGPSPVSPFRLAFTPRAAKILDYSVEEARNMQLPSINMGVQMLAIIREHDGVATQVLMNMVPKFYDFADKLRDKVSERS